jgi:hypothetical protein
MKGGESGDHSSSQKMRKIDYESEEESVTGVVFSCCFSW